MRMRRKSTGQRGQNDFYLEHCFDLFQVERRGKMKKKARVRIKPHINVGSDFQAELPELQARPPTEDEEHASLVWKPWEDTDSVMETHDRGICMLFSHP
ncbi:PREDICTED: zinc finger protein 541-like [Lepidothrix coronata]|uniref:Zinc finger protein 541-like n=1 Tax=Lepidothrix coronata TaxID=321398 RepID=A0A6J0GNS7_9PASS|nr:PREDICTED: zinc finger protein 541-like [Lepidothrix coronata]